MNDSQTTPEPPQEYKLMMYAFNPSCELSTTRERLAHAVIASFLGTEKQISMSNLELVRLTGVSLRSVSRVKAGLKASGLWDIRECGNQPTTYAPTEKLLSLIEKNEGHQL